MDDSSRRTRSMSNPSVTGGRRTLRSGLRKRKNAINYDDNNNNNSEQGDNNGEESRRSRRIAANKSEYINGNGSISKSIINGTGGTNYKARKRKLPSKKSSMNNNNNNYNHTRSSTQCSNGKTTNTTTKNENDADEYFNESSKRIIIIGAGMAGCACARELMERKHQVLVLEARHRPGGRIKTLPLHLGPSITTETSLAMDNSTEEIVDQSNTPQNSSHTSTTNSNHSNIHHHNNTCPVDMGGALIHGINKNPIYDLCNNVGISTAAMNREDSKLLEYRSAGWTVDVKADKKVQRRFNHVLEKAMDMSEKILSMASVSSSSSSSPCSNNSQSHENGVATATTSSASTCANASATSTNGGDPNDVLIPTNNHENFHKDLPIPEGVDQSTSFGALFRYYASDEKIPISNNRDESNDTNSEKECCSGNYPLNSIEAYLFQWHVLNLEMACGASFDDLGLAWNEDEQFSFGGPHVLLKEGFGHLIQKMAEGIDIEFGMDVTGIRVMNPDDFVDTDDTLGGTRQEIYVDREEEDSHCVEIRTRSGETFQADAVICTLPLGVLKDDKIKFYPPLSQQKQQAISRLGYGSYNKCALSFPAIFWNSMSDFFGVIGSPVAGTSILFCNASVLHNLPILVLIYGGSYAYEMESLTDEVVVGECMAVLRRVCGEHNNVPDPIDYSVTRWGKDCYARGAFSYVPPGVDGLHERRIMSEPVYYTNVKQEDGQDHPDISQRDNTIAATDNEDKKINCTKKLEDKSIRVNISLRYGKLPDETLEAIIVPKQEIDWASRSAILFAGEATSLHHPSTIHGAYLSGIREAYRFDLTVDPHLNDFIQFDHSTLYRKTFSLRSSNAKNARKVSQELRKSVEVIAPVSYSSGTRKSKRKTNKLKTIPTEETQNINGVRKSRRSHKPNLNHGVAGSIDLESKGQQDNENQHLTRSLVQELALLRGMDNFGGDKNGFNLVKEYMFPMPTPQSYESEQKRTGKRNLGFNSLGQQFESLVQSHNSKVMSSRKKCSMAKWMAPKDSDRWWLSHTPEVAIPRDANSQSSSRISGRRRVAKRHFDEMF